MKNSPGKAPSRQWYFKDWMADGELQMASTSTRGIWINMLCTMMDESVRGRNEGEGILRLNMDGIMRMAGATMEESELFLTEAELYGFCEIKRDGPDFVQIMSRRINRESEKRIEWRKRKEKQRHKEKQNNDVTQSSNENHAASPIPSPNSYSSKAKSKDDFDAKKPVLEPDIQKSTNLAAQRLEKYKSKEEETEKRTWGKE